MRPLAIIRRILGTMLFLLGIVGILLPIFPGVLFMGIGLYVLSKDSPGLQLRLAAIRERSHLLDRLLGAFERNKTGKEPDRHDTLQP